MSNIAALDEITPAGTPAGVVIAYNNADSCFYKYNGTNKTLTKLTNLVNTHIVNYVRAGSGLTVTTSTGNVVVNGSGATGVPTAYGVVTTSEVAVAKTTAAFGLVSNANGGKFIVPTINTVYKVASICSTALFYTAI
jgi:hypothetical protein